MPISFPYFRRPSIEIDSAFSLRRNGFVLMGFSTLLFSIISALAKLAATHMPSSEVVFFRSVFTVVFLVGLHIGLKKPGPLLGRNRRLLLLRGAMGAGSLITFFYSLSGLPVADATLLFQAAPIFVLPMGAVCLHESIGKRQLVMIPIALAGIALVLQPSFQMVNLAGLAALGSAFFTAGAHVCVRKLADENADTVVFYLASVSTLVSIPFMLPGFVWPECSSWLVLLAIGVLAVASQLGMTLAYRFDTAGRIAVVLNLAVVFSGVWDLAFWSHLPSTSTLIGAVLIICSLWVIHFFPQKESSFDIKKRAKAP